MHRGNLDAGGWGEVGKNRGIGGSFPHCPPPIIICFHTLSYLDPPRSVGDPEGILHFSYSQKVGSGYEISFHS